MSWWLCYHLIFGCMQIIIRALSMFLRFASEGEYIKILWAPAALANVNVSTSNIRTQTNSWKWCSRFGEQHANGAIFYAICTFVEFTMKTIYFLRISFYFAFWAALSLALLSHWCTFLIVFRILWIDRYAFGSSGIASIHLTILFFLFTSFFQDFICRFSRRSVLGYVCVFSFYSEIKPINIFLPLDFISLPVSLAFAKFIWIWV